jgi:hypothetical protein
MGGKMNSNTGESQQGNTKHVEYRAHIPEDIYVKLQHLKIYYHHTKKYDVRSVNDIILMAIIEFLEKHEDDLTASNYG